MSETIVTATAAQSPISETPGLGEGKDKRARDRDVQLQMRAMHAVVRPRLQDPAQDAFWTGRWETYLLLAARRVYSNRTQFYRLRAIAVISSVIVPSLVGLNLSGTGGVWVRWTTFALSLVAAVSAATLALFRFGDRWFLYRDLQNELLQCGWSFAEDSGPDAATAWSAFVNATNAAIEKYNGTYEAELSAAAKNKSESSDK